MTWRNTNAGGNILSNLRRLRHPDSTRHVYRFATVGVGCVALDFVLYTALTMAGMPTHPAKGLSYLSGTVVGFIANKWWTFGSQRKTVAEPVSYLAVYATTLGINLLVNGWVLHHTGHWLLAFLIATGITTVGNFLGLRWITFRIGIRQRRFHDQQTHGEVGDAVYPTPGESSSPAC